jgi:hypothetical protein
MEIEKIKTLWTIYNGLIERVKELQLIVSHNSSEKQLLLSHQKAIDEIEKISSEFMQNNFDYTLENIYQLCGKQKSIKIDFVPGSLGYKTYGFSKSVNICFTTEEVDEFSKNINLKHFKHGVLNFKRNDNFEMGQCNTNEILHISSR